MPPFGKSDLVLSLSRRSESVVRCCLLAKAVPLFSLFEVCVQAAVKRSLETNLAFCLLFSKILITFVM
ncbi:hypothetical protein JCM6294_1896 [Bacteroides pyogenes DSM 20611 = JCM 6294]|uniref:Uncharacterized protein n=1 Tax=Bacteroides pyogenes DSM 20611 = JCM 6294 TaxID=1121100 RepID=W4PHR7_9BACE|nr:hypothetical protein JCM6294_1896 [Bacteroides pyogenes DSM 20611 = JCM 6294]